MFYIYIYTYKEGFIPRVECRKLHKKISRVESRFVKGSTLRCHGYLQLDQPEAAPVGQKQLVPMPVLHAKIQ